ncbi:nuclear transport factor 2 family protein [Pedobacter deserti]|uniref:nuclear transport factor 2 family protein n=1 Tax=Pedobacter deserti TaxID=2817382 RepID=UPI0021095AC9|nr:nuclear transport factor 2 family protein [Pedobacter sp. SYSU D00382]
MSQTKNPSTNLEVARLFSSGAFDQVAGRLAENVEFHIYEDDKHLLGKDDVMEFCHQIAAYFSSVDTDFREHGFLEAGNKVVVYGYATFKRDGRLVNSVNSCDVYEFNSDGFAEKIHSYCNSKPEAKKGPTLLSYLICSGVL